MPAYVSLKTTRMREVIVYTNQEFSEVPFCIYTISSVLESVFVFFYLEIIYIIYLFSLLNLLTYFLLLTTKLNLLTYFPLPTLAGMEVLSDEDQQGKSIR